MFWAAFIVETVLLFRLWITKTLLYVMCNIPATCACKEVNLASTWCW